MAGRRRLLGTGLALTALACGGGRSIAAAHGLALAIPTGARAVRTTGGFRLVHEVLLTNFGDIPLSLEQLQVDDPSTSAVLLTFEGLRLRDAVAQSARGADHARLSARSVAVLYLDAILALAPSAIRYRLTYRGTGDSATIESAAQQLAVDVVALAPPLAGGPWAAIHDPSLERGHRRMVYAVAGVPRIPGRFAVDWFAVPDGGGAWHPSAGLGTPVLAVADGVVAAVRDDVPDPADVSAPRSVPAVDASGNFVAIDIGNGRFAFFEHLQRGLAVRHGDRVKKGQPIGRIGVTGQATGAHLHFHVADRLSLLDAEGVPFVLDRGSVLGGYSSLEEFSRSRPWVATASPQSGAGCFPMPNAVMRFDAAPGS